MKFPAFDPIDLKNNVGSFSIVELQAEYVIADPNQPRKIFNKDSLEELAASIKQHGIIQPIIVKEISDRKYQIIAGERRWRASLLANIKVVPAIIQKNTSQENDLITSLIENIQREELNPIELAESFRKLNDEHNFTHEFIALMVGKNRTTVTNLLRLLNLDEYVQDKIINAELEMGHVRPLIALPVAQQIILANEMIKRKLTVRGAENLVKLYKQPVDGKNNLLSEEVDMLAKDLSDKLSSKVTANINYKGEGKIVIHFSGPEMLIEFINQCMHSVNI